MSYHIIRHIKVNEKDGTVFIKGSDNNIYPKNFRYWECQSLNKILQEQGREELDIVILKEYESGNFQGGSNRYTRALKVLYYMPQAWPKIRFSRSISIPPCLLRHNR